MVPWFLVNIRMAFKNTNSFKVVQRYGIIHVVPLGIDIQKKLAGV